MLSDPERRATYDRYGHEGLRSGGFEPHFQGFGVLRRHLRRVLRRRRPLRWAAQRPDAGRRRRGGGRGLARRRGARPLRDRGLRRGRALRALPRQRRRARHADRDLRALRRRGSAPVGAPDRVRADGAHRRLRRVRGRRSRGQGAVHGVPGPRACRQAESRWTSRCRPASPTGSASASRGAATTASAAVRPATSTCSSRSCEDERFLRDGNDLVTVVDVPAPLAALGTRVTVPTLEGEEELEIPAGTQPRDVFELRGHGMPSLRRTLGGTGGRAGDLRVVVNVVIPRHLNAEQRDLLERLADSIGPENLAGPAEEHGVFAKLRRAFGAGSDPARDPGPPRGRGDRPCGAARARALRRGGGRPRR